MLLFKWNDQKVIVKKIRLLTKSKELSGIKCETSLAISLLHPNIVKVYGTTVLDDGRLGIVMEFADWGDMSIV